jgi:hypothetical protein
MYVLSFHYFQIIYTTFYTFIFIVRLSWYSHKFSLFSFISDPILFVYSTSDVNTSQTSSTLLPIITTSSEYAWILLHLSKIFPRVSNLDLLVHISNTILNSKGAIVSPCLNHLFILNTEDKCLPILTLVCNTLFKILHNLTIWGGI